MTSSSSSKTHASSPTEKTCRVLLVGPESVCVFNQLRGRVSDAMTHLTTAGIDLYTFKLGDIKFNVWVTAGEERFHSITQNYIRNAQLILTCSNDIEKHLEIRQKYTLAIAEIEPRPDARFGRVQVGEDNTINVEETHELMVELFNSIIPHKEEPKEKKEAREKKQHEEKERIVAMRLKAETHQARLAAEIQSKEKEKQRLQQETAVQLQKRGIIFFGIFQADGKAFPRVLQLDGHYVINEENPTFVEERKVGESKEEKTAPNQAILSRAHKERAELTQLIDDANKVKVRPMGK